LTAIENDVAVLPLSGAVEVAYTRSVLSQLLGGIGQPYLVLRLGVPEIAYGAAPRTPRLPADQVIENK
jgi:hypothetical protein